MTVPNNPADTKPADKKPARKKPVGKKPVGKKPVGKKPAGKKPAGKKPMYAIGIMSGTSADGIDGVVLEIKSTDEFEIVATHSSPITDDLRKSIRQVAARQINSHDQSDNLDIELAHCFADATEALISKIASRDVAIVGIHGQTVNHQPDDGYTIQLGNGKKMAELLALPVVTNFRDADIAAGGQGAPLVPGFHRAAFSSDTENRVVVNIGGVSNITFLPATAANIELDVIGFDTGPGNTLMDFWCRTKFNREYDENGDLARGGELQLDLLDVFLKDQYFADLPPKSTGLDYFNEKWLKDKMMLWEGHGHSTDEDVLMTLTYLTARAIGDQVNNLTPGVDAMYVSGGGAKNQLMMEILQDKSRSPVALTSDIGIDPQWVEAAAFAWMAFCTLHAQPSTLPSVTGAKHPTIAGVIHQPD